MSPRNMPSYKLIKDLIHGEDGVNCSDDMEHTRLKAGAIFENLDKGVYIFLTWKECWATRLSWIKTHPDYF